MKSRISRRKFMSLTAAIGSMAVIPGSLFRKAYAKSTGASAKLISVESTNHYEAAIKAVEALGGMSKFVSQNSKVGLLINGNWTNEATYTNPDISLAVLKMCFDAGAGEVMIIKGDKVENWKKSTHYESHKEFLNKSTKSKGDKVFPIEKGVVLKEAEMVQELLEFDTLINIPISKHHNAAFMTCCLKNMMGLCTRSTNVLFHSATGERPTDKDRLAQCIADLNTLRKADLTIVDASSFITTGGPQGPGEILTVNKVLAGTDPVALDAHCASFLDYDPGMVMSTDYAAEHQLGVADLDKIEVFNV